MTKAWADNIRWERKDMGLTIGECANMIGCDIPRYSALERGVEEPTELEVVLLAMYLRQQREFQLFRRRVEAMYTKHKPGLDRLKEHD